MTFPVQRIRARFPALSLRHNSRQRIYFDNPAGTQITRQALQSMREYLYRSVGNSGGVFRTSRDTDTMVADTRVAMAQFLNARSPREIVFGASMTTLTLHMTRALEPRFSRGDEIIVTRMDHDANVTPWRLLAERCGVTVKQLDFHDDTYRYDLGQFERLLSPRTKLVAINHASNLLGTINDVGAITHRARAIGALTYVDAVQSAPHCVLDVQALGCDFLVCSAYKFFGPHLGILWGREELLESLMPPKLKAATDTVPNRYETGTLPFELIAALRGAIEYYAWVGDTCKPPKRTKKLDGARRVGAANALRERINRGKLVMNDYEKTLSRELISAIGQLAGAKIYGITAEGELDERVSTVAFTLPTLEPQFIASELAKREIYVWSGGNYALGILDKLSLADSGGVVRVGPVHYNTVAEIERFLAAMKDIVRRGARG